MSDDFVWRDAGRVVLFRRDGVEQAPELLREQGFGSFDLLSTARALRGAPRLSEAADTVHEVDPGKVPDAARSLLDAVGGKPLVGFGGGRAIDTAKAIAAVTGVPVAAIPTTLSGAEITGIHRLPAGAEDRVRGMVRPRLAIADPERMTSQPERALRASAMNSLAHGADSLYTPLANPVSRMTALHGAELIATALDASPEGRDRAALALGSVLCAYAIDSAAFGLHHVVCQTLVQVCGAPHAETNAAILPNAMAFMVPRAPEALASLARSLGTPPEEIGPRIRELGGEPAGLGRLGADRSRLDAALEAMVSRPELGSTPDPPTREDLEQMIDAAW